MDKTIDDLNDSPLNKRAKEMLILAGEEPDPDSLYCIQLALWGITKKNMDIEEGIKEFINAMTTWRPSRLMNFFMLPYDDGMDFDLEHFSTPEALARAIIDYIEDKITTHFPFNFTAE